MADLFVGCNVGGKLPKDLTVGAASAAKDIELRVKVSATPLATRIAVLEALEAIEYYFDANSTYTP